ncbi:ATP-binding cassette domain-containing protein [Planctomicrobium sp. SH668]|uniref:ATP-binding cassette domain-containing protein n=1 Tax=Planctomicrobium sp. SH668 TaxID=3448126 RepID=UPI003F5C9C62
MAEFEVKDIGAVKSLSINAPPGHVTVLKGPNGSGKTTTLEAITKITNGSKAGADISFSDGAKGGFVQGEGVTFRLSPTGNAKRTGELSCTPVDEDLTIADIVDPDVKDPVAADRRRIEAICSMLNIAPEIRLFDKCFEDTGLSAKDVVSEKALKSTTIVGMTNQIKRDADAVALALEKEAAGLDREIATINESLNDLNLEAESNQEVLDGAVEMATNTLAMLNERKRSAEEGRTKLDEIPNFSIERAHAELSQAEEVLRTKMSVEQELKSLITSLEEQIESARTELRVASESVKSANEALVAAQERINLIQTSLDLKKLVSDAPDAEEIEAAAEVLAIAKKNRDLGVLIRRGIEQKALIEKKETERDQKEKEGANARFLGKKCVKVLEGLLTGTGLTVNEEGRIRVVHSRRGECYFSELSDGERWTKSIQIAVESFKRKRLKNPLLLLPQKAWQDLDKTRRDIVCDAIRGTDLAILTAECDGTDEDPLVAETL